MKRINLIPEEAKRMTPAKWLKVNLLRSRMARAVAIIAIGFVLLNIWQATTILRYKIAIIAGKRSTAALQSKMAQAQEVFSQLKRERERIEKESKRIEEKLKVLAAEQGEKIPWAKTLLRITKLVPEDLWINKVVLNKEILTVSGTTFNNAVVSNFMSALDASGYFKDTAFNFTQKSKLEDKPVIDFEVTTHVVAERAIRE